MAPSPADILDTWEGRKPSHQLTLNGVNPIMFNPHMANHQYITDQAASAAAVLNALRDYPAANTNDLEECFANRIHELMRFRSHTVNTDW